MDKYLQGLFLLANDSSAEVRKLVRDLETTLLLNSSGFIKINLFSQLVVFTNIVLLLHLLIIVTNILSVSISVFSIIIVYHGWSN